MLMNVNFLRIINTKIFQYILPIQIKGLSLSHRN
uniref:Uncharacterized protein n=1 Tax=Myoviridae sp. ctPuP5 TaxID=2823543 RepID=A0A8S5L9S6_9CAUD|nr:MAG TPA: hypothetical protein [Myoviridae sp. ctPuP5]